MMRALIMCGVLVVAATACTTGPWRKPEPEPVAQFDPLAGEEEYDTLGAAESSLALSAELRFPDVPVPEDVSLDLDRTFVYESPTLQVGQMVYTTRASIGELVAFYLSECRAAGWQQAERTDWAGAELVYTKSGQRLTVIIRPLGVARSRLLTLRITPEEKSGTSWPEILE